MSAAARKGADLHPFGTGKGSTLHATLAKPRSKSIIVAACACWCVAGVGGCLYLAIIARRPVGLQGFGHLVEHVGGLVDPATLHPGLSVNLA